MALPTSPTSNKLSSDRIRLLLYGPPGAGKTTFAAGFNPEANVIIDCEGGTRFLPGQHYVVKPKTYTEFRSTVVELAAGQHKFKVVTIDTVDALVRMADEESAKRFGKTAAALVEFGKGTTDRNAAVMADIQKLLATDLGVILISHAARQTVAVDGQEQERFFPSIPKGNEKEPGLREFFMGRTDFLWAATNYPKRELLTQPNSGFEVKSRVPLPAKLPLDPVAVNAALKAGVEEVSK